MQSIVEKPKKDRVRDEGSGYVYALLHACHTCPQKSKLCQSHLSKQDAIKIGFTCSTPAIRQEGVEKSEVQHRLQLLYAIAVDRPRSMESTLHHVFRPLRIRGEWFRYDTTYLPKFPEIVGWYGAYQAAVQIPDIDNWGMIILAEHFEERLSVMDRQMPLQTAMQGVMSFTPRKKNAGPGWYVFSKEMNSFYQKKGI